MVVDVDEFEYMDRGVGEYAQTAVCRGPACHIGGVRSYGNASADVMFIGISPAQHEVNHSGRPLTGPAGQCLNACLEAIGLHRKDIYTTNIVCTWMDKISFEDINKCWSRLVNEINVLKPKFIVLMGKDVTEFVMNRPFGKVRGAVQWCTDPKFRLWYPGYIMGTYHSAALLHGMGDQGSSKDDKASVMIYDFIRDLKKIKDVIEWEPEAPEASVRYRVVNSLEQAQNVLDNLPRSADFPVALDVETTYNKDDEEVEVFENEVLCVGVGTDNYCWVFTPGALFKPQEDGKIVPALNWPNLHWTMHNSIFDSQVMKRNLDVWINVAEDTMLQSYSLDERSGVHRLKTLSREYLGAGFYEDDRFYGKMKLDEIPREMLYEYNAKDVVYTARLQKKFEKWQVEDNVRNFYSRLLIPAVNMYKELQYHGVNINMDMHLKFTFDWGVRIINEEDALQEMAKEEGWEGELNLQSPDQLATFLFEILSLPVVKYTRGGKRSVDREVIEALREQHAFIPRLEGIRRLYKMWGTYIEKLPKQLKVDGRAHPIVKLHGTTTGRPSYTGLAVQTFVAPSAPHEFNQMRKLIIAPPYTGYEGTDDYAPVENDEYVIVEVDVGKAELWQAYTYGQDPQMLADLLSGDYHTNVAMDIYQKEKEQITGDDRTGAKRTSFGILYDIKENTLAKLTRSTPLESRLRIKRWRERNNVYQRWFEATQQEIQETGELVFKTERKRRIIVFGNAHRVVKQAVNAPIQSTSSDVVLDSAVKMHPLIKRIGGHLLFTVHDSIVTKALRSRLHEHCQIMHDVMIGYHFDGVVRMPVEIKIGRTWGDVKGVHDCSESREHKENIGNNEWGLSWGGHCLYPYYRDELGVTLPNG